MEKNEGYKTIMSRLEEQHIVFTPHEHEGVKTIAEAEEKLTFPKEFFLKTIVFKIKSGGWILTALRGQDNVDYRKLADAAHIKRSEITQTSVEEIEAIGYEIGGICPIPLAQNMLVIFDDNVSAFDKVYCGSGRNSCTLEIKLADLLHVSGGQICPIARQLQQEVSNRRVAEI